MNKFLCFIVALEVLFSISLGWENGDSYDHINKIESKVGSKTIAKFVNSKKRCPALEDIENGEMEKLDKKGMSVRFECDDGYTLVGNAVLNCIKQKKKRVWDSVPPRCAPECAPLCKPNNGAISLSSALSEGSVATFTCDAGFENIGDSTYTCANGTWQYNKEAECVDKNECAINNGGCSDTCVNTIGSFHCECPCGYKRTLGKCEDIDECFTNNGGCDHVCRNTDGRYQCDCNKGYWLKEDLQTCEDINECTINNGGCDQNCTNTIGSFTCSCMEGYIQAKDPMSCIECEQELDVVFLLDGSGSVDDIDFAKMKVFVSKVIESFTTGPNNYKVGVVVFSSSGTSRFYLDTFQDKNDMINSINGIVQPHGGTAMHLGLQQVENQLSPTRDNRPGVQNAVVVLTDGSFNDAVAASQKANEIKATGTYIFSIGIGSGAVLDQVKGLSSQPQVLNKNYFMPSDFDVLVNQVTEVLTNELCQSK